MSNKPLNPKIIINAMMNSAEMKKALKKVKKIIKKINRSKSKS